MDPFLEAPQHWHDLQNSFMTGLSEVLQPSIGDRYRLRVLTRTYVLEQVLFTSILREEQREDFLEIRQRASGKVVTLVDLISPTNRTTAKGRKEYTSFRDLNRQQGAHLVEMEFVMQGQTCLDISTSGLPEHDYLVSVCRARQQDRYEIYTTTLQKRLPRIRLPLAADDRDIVIDLQTVFARGYDQCFTGKVDYAKDPPMQLKDTDQKWMQALLTQLKLRPNA
jgi:hypothetical protein